jgi:hypothetical protein
MFRRGRDVQHVARDRGEIWVWRLAPSIYASRVQGHLERDMAQAIIDLASPQYAAGAVSGFHDWFGMTGYDSRSRVDLTGWIMEHRSQTRLCIGVKSRLVAMGVSVANLALGGNLITSFSEIAPLEAVLARCMRT